MAKVIIEMDFGDKPKSMLNMIKGAIEQQMKDQVKQFGMNEESIKVRIEE